ncbi:MAG: COQ9 family protein, partial [Holosporales bacterium]|nr:COQ9 family protein [Holosporales bacterium]
TILEIAVEEMGYPTVTAWALFPGGVEDALCCWSRQVDAQLRSTLSLGPLENLKVRERIFWGVRTRFQILEPQKAAVAEAARFFLNPLNTCQGFKLLQETVHTLWVAAGDTSTDLNYYSKRLLLSGVYGATFLYWLKDTSLDHEKTWEFLKNRIDSVMKIQKVKGKFQEKTAQAKMVLTSLLRTFLPPKK